MNGPGLWTSLVNEQGFLFHFHLRLSFGVFDECSLVVIIAPADGFSEPGALSIRTQMTNDKMENGKCLRLRYNARGVSE